MDKSNRPILQPSKTSLLDSHVNLINALDTEEINTVSKIGVLHTFLCVSLIDMMLAKTFFFSTFSFSYASNFLALGTVVVLVFMDVYLQRVVYMYVRGGRW